MGEETFKAAVWYKGKIVNEDGNNPRYVGGIVKFIDVDLNTKPEVFLCTIRDIFGIPKKTPITVKYHIFFSSEISKLLDITPYESLKAMLQPGVMLHPFYVQENVFKDGTDTFSSMPRCSRTARNSSAIQSPPGGVEIPVRPSARVHVNNSVNRAQTSFQAPVRSVKDQEDPANAVGDRLGRTSPTNSSQVPFDFERTATVWSMRKRIQPKIKDNIPPEDLRLMYAGKRLMDDDTLVSLGIAEGSIIHVMACIRGC